MKVRDVMTQQTAFCGPETNLAQAARYAKKKMGSCVRRIRRTATLCEKREKPTYEGPPPTRWGCSGEAIGHPQSTDRRTSPGMIVQGSPQMMNSGRFLKGVINGNTRATGTSR